jgi:hypothetical protein
MLHLVFYGIVLTIAYALFEGWGVVGAVVLIIIKILIGTGIQKTNTPYTQLAQLADEFVNLHTDLLTASTGTLHPKYYCAEVSRIMTQILNKGVGAESPDPTANKIAYEVSIGTHKVIQVDDDIDKTLIESIGKFMLRKALQNQGI